MRLSFSLLLIAAIIIDPSFTALVTWQVHVKETSASNVEPSASSTQASQILQDYIYGYSPVAMEAARALQTAVPNATVIPGRAPINQFAYRDTLAKPEECTIVRPNADTLYTNAWLDLAREPIVLHVPDTAGRYYLIPMLDAYSNVFASVGSRTTGNAEGNIAIVGPFWRGTLPAGLRGVIHAPTNTVWMIGRTLVHGEADLPDAVAVTRQNKLVPLSAYSHYLATGSYAPPPFVPVTRPNADFIGKPITGSPGFSKPEFFDVLAAYARINPAPADQRPQASQLVRDGFFNKNQLTSDVVKEANAAFVQKMKTIGTVENGWSINLHSGSYGADYLERATLTHFGFGTNVAADAVYPSTARDAAGKWLDGTNRYVIHLAPGEAPPVHGFWSLTVYDTRGCLVANSSQRYAVGSATDLVPNADGSIDILLQSTSPAPRQSNWLPVPNGPFNLTMRLYWPDVSVLNGTWKVPPVEQVPGVP